MEWDRGPLSVKQDASVLVHGGASSKAMRWRDFEELMREQLTIWEGVQGADPMAGREKGSLEVASSSRALRTSFLSKHI